MENKIKDDEVEIDLGKLSTILWARKKVVAKIVALCTGVALCIAFIIPPTYESNTLVQTQSASKLDLSGATAALAALGTGSGAVSPANNYIEMMKSRAVLDPILDCLEDIPPEKREKMTAEGFAKTNLNIENVKNTNLIRVTAKGRSPEEAQMIASNVVDNFLKMMTEMNQNSQSYMVKFLNERISEAKKEADDAATKLAEYQKENKIYKPDEQAKLAIEQLNAYDKAISEMQVQQKSAQAQYDVATQKLSEQKAGALNFNINDNSTVQSIRSQIVAKEVDLVRLRQKYMDEHPDIVSTKKQLNQLNQALINEVGAIVNSNAASMNSAQIELVKNQALAQAKVSAASASEVAIREKKTEKEGEIGKLPDAMVSYIQLESESKIKQHIYTTLVQQCEQNKLQEAMDSMDIQIIDTANLPVEKSAPKRMLIACIGMIVGIIISVIYGFLLYRKEEYDA